MKMIVGLGNPGRKYQQTRHNVGYMVLDELARKQGAGSPKSAFQGEVATVEVGGEKILLLWPHTFMNRSGSSVLAARDFYKLTNSDILIVADDFNLPLAKLRFRSKGSSGGQKGLADVIRCLGTEEVARLRLGIGPLPAGWDPPDFVLGRFTESERTEVQIAVQEAVDAVTVWIRAGRWPA
jgi:PTH1 family peptidyl-tRNA hydrolase